MARPDRTKLIREIEKKRQSKLITFVTGDRRGLPAQVGPDALPVIEKHIRAVSGPRTKSIDLFLYSRGGDANVPWAAVGMLREFLGERRFNVLIPFRAHSAATVISLGADQIVMTRNAELGPIDATIPEGPHNPKDEDSKKYLPISVEDARGYFNFLDEISLTDQKHKMEAFKLLSERVHPLALGQVNRLLSSTSLVARQLLNGRLEPLNDEENERIVTQLSSEIFSHAHAIHLHEAKEIGLSFAISAKDDEIEDDLWDLYRDYAELLSIEEPFLPNDEMVENDLESKKWTNLPIACIESTSRTDIFSLNITARRLRQVPPQVTFDMSNLSISIPPIPSEADQNELQQFISNQVKPLIQAQIQQATDAAVKALVASLPHKGFEIVHTNAYWKLDRSGR